MPIGYELCSLLAEIIYIIYLLFRKTFATIIN